MVAKPIRQLLIEIGNRYNCYFTLETGFTSGRAVKSFDRNIDGDLSGPKRVEMLGSLQKVVPNLGYQINSRNERIIHVFDTRLRDQPGYALEATIPSFRFDGNVGDLIDRLEDIGFGVTPRAVFDSYEALGLDLKTEVRIREQNQSVRQILTGAFRLRGRGRILWIAETEFGGGKKTSVRYLR